MIFKCFFAAFAIVASTTQLQAAPVFYDEAVDGDLGFGDQIFDLGFGVNVFRGTVSNENALGENDFSLIDFDPIDLRLPDDGIISSIRLLSDGVPGIDFEGRETFTIQLELGGTFFTCLDGNSGEYRDITDDPVEFCDDPGVAGEYFWDFSEDQFSQNVIFSNIQNFGLNGTFPGTIQNYEFQITVDGEPIVAPIPLPASLPLLAFGLGGLIWLRRRAVA